MFYATDRARLAAQVACPDSLYHSNSREGFVPRLVNGRPVKAWNRWYNKRMKELKKQLPKEERENGRKEWTDAHPGGGGRAAPGIPAASRPAGGAPHG